MQIRNSQFQVNSDFLTEAQAAVESVLRNSALGFHQLPERFLLWESCQALAKQLRANYTKMVVLGIGGSSLGGKVLQEACRSQADRSVIFLDSIDPLFIHQFLLSIESELKSVCWALISKSGNTIETLTQADYIHQFYQEQNLDWPQQCVVVTEPKESPLGSFAHQYNLPRLEVPLDVGGRFSVLSPVGLLPAAFMGLDLEALRRGAIQARQSLSLLSQLVAQCEMSFQREEWITVFWSYSSSLKEFGFWVQQLWAESLAKKRDRNERPAPRVSSPLPCLGPADQHSILQQIAEGAKDKFVIFLRNEAAEKAGSIISKTLFSGGELMVGKKLGELLAAEAQATQLGLEQQSVSTLTLQISAVTEKELGFLFMFFELVVAALGERLNIDAFNQPGVELGKLIAKKILSER